MRWLVCPSRARARAIRAGTDVGRRSAVREPLAQPAAHGRSRIGRRVTGTDDGRAAVADHRTAAAGDAGRRRSSTRQRHSRRRRDPRRARADLRVAFAQLVAAQAREQQLTAGAIDCGAADILAKREAAGDAASFDRLRAEREVSDVEADVLSATTDRARRRRPSPASSPTRAMLLADRRSARAGNGDFGAACRAGARRARARRPRRAARMKEAARRVCRRTPQAEEDSRAKLAG